MPLPLLHRMMIVLVGCLLLSGSWAEDHGEISLGQQYIKDIHHSLRGNDPVHTFSAISDGIEHQLNTRKSLNKVDRDGNTKELASTIRSLIGEVTSVDQEFLLQIDSDNDISEALQSTLDDFSPEELDDVTDEQLVAMFRFANGFKGHEEHLEGLKDIIRTLDNVIPVLPVDHRRRLQEEDAHEWLGDFDFAGRGFNFPNFNFVNTHKLDDMMKKARESARQRFTGFRNSRHHGGDGEGRLLRVQERNYNRRRALAHSDVNPVCFPPCDITNHTCQCQRLFNCIGDMSSYDMAVRSTLDYIDSSTGNYTKEDVNVFDLQNGGILGKYFNAKESGLLNDPSDLSSCTTVLEEFHTTCDPMSETRSCPNDDEQAQSFQLSVEQVCESVDTTAKLLFEPMHRTFETAYYGSSCGLTREQVVWVGCGTTFLTEYEFYKWCSGTPSTSKIIFDSGPGKTSCGIINDQTVYSGCGFTYAFEDDCMEQCCASPGCTSCVQTKANVNGWIDPNVATDDSYCGSVSLAACATFAQTFDRLYQARKVEKFRGDNPMLARSQVPVYNMKNNSIWNNIVFPTSYRFYQSDQGVNYPEDVFEVKYTDTPNFPGRYILGTNIALGKPATQSSTFNSDYPASKAVDGDLSTISQTDADKEHTWWKVDLQQTYEVQSIKIFNRLEDNDGCRSCNCCSDRLHDFYIKLYGADGFTVVAEQHITDTVGSERNFLWPRNSLARFVEISMLRKEFLHFREVQVYGNYLGMNEGPNCVYGQFDNLISSQVASTCDESMALLLGDNMSLGTLIAIVNDIEANGIGHMPGTCCQDDPTTSEFFGSFYSPKEDMTCQHQGLWHFGISPSACKNGGGRWFRNPCVPLKECIDARPDDDDGPVFSSSFEDWAVDLVILDANDEAQCAHTRQGLGFEADYPYDAVVCDEFNRVMCSRSFDDLDDIVDETSPVYDDIIYQPIAYPGDPKLEKIPLPELATKQKVDDKTSKPAIDALRIAQQAAAHSFQIVSFLGRKESALAETVCNSIPGGGAIGGIAQAVCFLATLFTKITISALEFVTLSLWIATANTFVRMNQKKPNYAKLNYGLIFEDREWNFQSLNVINDNIFNQHMVVREQLQDTHNKMVNDININTVKTANEQACQIINALGGECTTSGRRLESGEVPEVNIEVSWPENARGMQNVWSQLRSTDRSVDKLLEDVNVEEPTVKRGKGRKPKHDKEDDNGGSLFGNRALAIESEDNFSVLKDVTQTLHVIEDNLSVMKRDIDREMSDMKGDIADMKGDIAEIKTQMSMLVDVMSALLVEKDESESAVL